MNTMLNNALSDLSIEATNESLERVWRKFGDRLSIYVMDEVGSILMNGRLWEKLT